MTDNNIEIRPDVLNYDDIRAMVPKLDGHPKFVNWRQGQCGAFGMLRHPRP